MLKSKMKPISTNEDGILTNLFRNIITETGLINSLPFLISRYIRNGGKKNKATIGKIIIDGEMTWKSFIFLIFEISRIKKMDIKLTLTHADDSTSEHELEVTPLVKKEGKDVVSEEKK